MTLAFMTSERSRILEPGMVLTVEPGLYIAPDADVPEQYRGIGIRIEDDIVITETGNENLTASVVKKPEEIEALMASCEKAMSVIIVGGGMAGATLALAISRLSHGALPVHLIEATAPESHAHPGFDGRAIALAAGTCQQLARIGVWQSLVRLRNRHHHRSCQRSRTMPDSSLLPQKITNWRR